MKVNCAHDEIVDIDQLVENPKNPNKHPDAQIHLLAKILKHQGWRSPIVVSTRSGFVIKGHGRLLAARLNGWTKVPVDRQAYESEAQEYADMVADNKISDLSEVDLSLVSADVADIMEEFNDFDLELLGIPDFELPGPGDAKEVSFTANTSKELDQSNFEKFEHECPKCGFEWND